ncbi:MAG: methyltransferase, TIGR04325 family, partial [Cyanobacteriota bacterium]
YSWPLLACLMLVAAIKENSLSVLDFGGSLGSTYFQNRKFLENLRNVQWGIVEQSKFVETGKDSFENETLKFFYDIDTCIKEIKPDVVILSSVLPYLETPYKFLEELLQRNIDYIIIDRTPVVDSNNDILTIQKVPPEIYEASYPAWFFSRQRLFNTIQKKYSLIEEFEALAGGIDIHNTKFSAIDKGFFLKRRD